MGAHIGNVYFLLSLHGLESLGIFFHGGILEFHGMRDFFYVVTKQIDNAFDLASIQHTAIHRVNHPVYFITLTSAIAMTVGLGFDIHIFC